MTQELSLRIDLEPFTAEYSETVSLCDLHEDAAFKAPSAPWQQQRFITYRQQLETELLASTPATFEYDVLDTAIQLMLLAETEPFPLDDAWHYTRHKYGYDDFADDEGKKQIERTYGLAATLFIDAQRYAIPTTTA